MSVFRIHKTENYTVMSNAHFKEKGMSLKAKGLLSLMLSLPDTWNYSVSGLVTLSKDGKDSVMSALAELEEFGYLKRMRQTNEKGQFSGVQYDIFEQPQPKEPISDKPISAIQNSEKPISENREQLNTNSIKNLDNKVFKELNTKTDEIQSILLDNVNDSDLRYLYWDYINMRNSIDAPLSLLGLEKLIERCKRLSKDNVRIQKLLLETAIINNWKNVYLPNESELHRVNQEVADDLRELFGLDT